MGDVISKAVDGAGGLLEKAFLAPFKSSCEDVCSGPWDLICFIEHLCVSDLLKLLMISVLCYITLLFFYLLFKLGIFQCIGKSLCKMCWAAFETYWYALEDIICFLWYKLVNTKRVNRRHRPRQFRDIEQGYSSSEENDVWDNYRDLYVSRNRKSLSKRRKDRLRSSIYHSSRHGPHSHHHVRMKSRGRSVRVAGRSQRLRSSRRLQLSKVKNVRRRANTSKRRRLG